MRICIVSYVFPKKNRPTLGTFVLEEARALREQGNKIVVITSGDRIDKNYERICGLEIFRVKSSFPLVLHLNYFLKILKLNKKYKFDLVHYHFIGPLTLICSLAARIIKKPFFITTYGLDTFPRPRHKTLDIVKKKLYTLFSDKIICYSNNTKDIIAKYKNENKLTVVNPGVDAQRLKPDKTKSQMLKELGIGKSYVLLSVSNIVRRKGYEAILNALHQVKKKIKSFVYIVVGEDTVDYKKDLLKTIEDLDLKDNVMFVGHKMNHELANYYNLCDVFVLMSKTIPAEAGIEGFGVVYIEAPYFSKPVIGGKSGGTSDAIEDGKTGFLIDPDDYKTLAEKLIMLLKNKKLRKTLGKAGKKRVMRKFLWKHSAGKIMEVYREATAKNDTFA